MDETLDELDMEGSPTASAHCTALELLGRFLISSTKSTAMEFRSLKRILDGIDGETDDVKIQLGNLYDLVQEHGSLADAVQTSLTSGGLVQGNLSDLRIEMDRSVCRVRQGVLRDGARYHLQDQGKGELAAPGYEEQTEDVGGGLGGCTPPPFAPANAKDFSRKHHVWRS